MLPASVLIFGAFIVLNIPYFSRIQTNFKDTHREKKHPKVKLKRFPKVWIWTFQWLVHQINSIYKVPNLKEDFRKRKVVTRIDPTFVIKGGPNSEHFLPNLRKLLKRGKFFLTTESLIVKRNWFYINQFIKTCFL